MKGLPSVGHCLVAAAMLQACLSYNQFVCLVDEYQYLSVWAGTVDPGSYLACSSLAHLRQSLIHPAGRSYLHEWYEGNIDNNVNYLPSVLLLETELGARALAATVMSGSCKYTQARVQL